MRVQSCRRVHSPLHAPAETEGTNRPSKRNRHGETRRHDSGISSDSGCGGALRKLIRNRAVWLLAASFAILFGCFTQQPAGAASQETSPTTANTSEQTASFSGFVRTAGGVGIPGASVRITNRDTGKSWATWTDAQGKFSLPALPLGHYHMAASQIGFAEGQSDFDLSSYNEKPSLITLNVATVAQLAAPAETPGG